MITIRRVPSSLPLSKLYEIRLDEGTQIRDRGLVLRRGLAVRRLETIVGVGEGWPFRLRSCARVRVVENAAARS